MGLGTSIVEAKRWKGGLGFGACYCFFLKKVDQFSTGKGEKTEGDENQESAF